MATHRIRISPLLPEASGDVYPDSSATADSNDRYPHEVLVFTDSGAKDTAGFSFQVPQNYVGTAKFVIVWKANATTGDVVWDVDYTAIATAESMDPSTDQEAVTATTTTNATALDRNETSITATGSNFAVGDEVLGNLGRDGAASDTLAASALVEGFYFEYSDA